MVLSKQSAAELIFDSLFPRWKAERERLQRIDDWYRWRHEDIRLPTGATREMRKLVEMSKVPWLNLVVSAVAQCMYVDGYRSGFDALEFDPEQPTGPWKTWLANGMPQRQIAIHRSALTFGYSYVKVLPGEDDEGKRSVMRGVSPRKAIAVYADPSEDEWPEYTLTVDSRGEGKGYNLSLYDNEVVLHFTITDEASKPVFVGAQVHGATVCPFIRYANQLDLDGRCDGEVEPYIPLAARINKTAYDRLLTQHFASWKIRTVTGMVEPDTQEAANRAKLQLRQDDLLVSESPDTKFGTLDETPLNGFIDSWRADIEALAAVTQTPTCALTGQMINLPLALDTVVPVPGGRTTMGELRVGDEVYTPEGIATHVTAVSAVKYGKPCYRLRFDDGTEIVADGDHEWMTTRFANPVSPYGRAGRVTERVTTRYIADTLRTKVGTYNHYIPVASAPDGPEREFLIHPYTLGVWLGNGDHWHGVITQHVDDAEPIADLLRDVGERVDVVPYVDHAHRNCRKLKIRHDIDPFVSRLKRLGVHRNKHIPEAYFHGSRKQRLALVQGLMDTDGSINRLQDSAVITLHNGRLAKDLHRLIQSLGHKVVLREREWTSRQLNMSGTCWRMSWGATDTVFRLDRKRQLQRTSFGGGDGRSNGPLQRYIVSCERVASVPVRCIRVQSPQHLFCVTDSFIATSNSAEALAAARSSLMQKTTERQKSFGASHVQALRLGAALEGQQEYADDVLGRVTWQDMEIRSFSQAVDALGKAATMLHVPLEALWQRIPGVEKSDVDDWKTMVEDGDPISTILQAMERQNQDANTNGPPPSGQGNT